MNLKPYFVWILVFSGATVAMAQRKPDLPPAQNVGAETAPDIALFKRAYETAGAPRLMVICGVDSRPQELALALAKAAAADRLAWVGWGSAWVIRDGKAIRDAIDEAGTLVKREQEATGDVGKNDAHAGRKISLWDPTGDSAKLQSDIEQILLTAQNVELVDPSTLAEADRREADLLAQRDDRDGFAIDEYQAQCGFGSRDSHAAVAGQAARRSDAELSRECGCA